MMAWAEAAEESLTLEWPRLKALSGLESTRTCVRSEQPLACGWPGCWPGYCRREMLEDLLARSSTSRFRREGREKIRQTRAHSHCFARAGRREQGSDVAVTSL